MAEEPDADDASAGKADAGPVGDATRYLEMITEAEEYFRAYHEKADNIDKLYSDLEKMANTSREREMQVFWANLEVLKPSIYARPPVPVVVPRFKDRKPIPRTTAEMLERALTTSFSTEDIDNVMKAIRDDLAINARGVVWLQFERKPDAKARGRNYECIRYRHLERRDFLHQPARKWAEVGWCAYRAWLTRKEGQKRFGDVWLEAAFTERQGDEEDEDEKLSKEQKAPVWELWHRADDLTVWVTPGVEELLDKSEPELTLEDFFPCPRPAYGTLQRRTLKPVPEYLYYKDQIEEINELTARISALAESLRLKGFYAAGASELAEVVEAALKLQSNNAVLVPVSNFAALGGTALKDAIVWLPVRDVAEVIKGCIELRRQLIEDVYQVTGLSDIMRGSTDPNETLGAQELKSQYGSIRIRDRQAELVRVARDITRIAAEIMAENFSPQTLLAMSQMEIPAQAMLEQQAAPMLQKKQQIVTTVQKVQQDPRAQQMAQQNPDKAKELLGKAQAMVGQIDQEVQKLMQQPTVERVMAFLRDQRIRPYVLDIETDSTIAPDENAQKKRATEFVTAVGGFVSQTIPVVQQVPQIAPLVGSFLKYVSSQFRAGRQLENDIDQFADAIAQPKPQEPSPEAQAMQAKTQMEAERAKADMAGKQQDAQLKQAGEQRATEATAADQQRAAQAAEQQTAIREREHAMTMQGMQAEQERAAEAHRMAKNAHAMEMRGKSLDIRRAGIETRQKAAEGATNGAAPNGADADAASEGTEPMQWPELEFEKTVMATLEQLGQQNVQIAKALAELGKAITAPKAMQVIRDGQGNITGGLEGAELILSDVANIGDSYNPLTGIFSAAEPAP